MKRKLRSYHRTNKNALFRVISKRFRLQTEHSSSFRTISAHFSSSACKILQVWSKKNFVDFWNVDFDFWSQTLTLTFFFEFSDFFFEFWFFSSFLADMLQKMRKIQPKLWLPLDKMRSWRNNVLCSFSDLGLKQRKICSKYTNIGVWWASFDKKMKRKTKENSKEERRRKFGQVGGMMEMKASNNFHGSNNGRNGFFLQWAATSRAKENNIQG